MGKVDHRGAGTHAKDDCCCLNGEAQDINRRVRDARMCWEKGSMFRVKTLIWNRFRVGHTNGDEVRGLLAGRRT